MKFDYVVATGIIVKEYIDEQEVTNEKLSEILGIDERSVSKFLDGKIGLTKDMALGLEKILPDISAEYWLNIEDKYNEFIATEKIVNEEKINDLDLIAKRFRFKEIFKGLDWSLAQQAKEMMNILKISSFEEFDNKYANLQVNFFEDGGEKEAIAIWLGLCEEEAELQEEIVDQYDYSKEKLKGNISKFKQIANNDDLDKTINSCKKLCNRLGIYFIELEAITNCKVRGALTTYKNHPAIFISRRFKTHDHTWFAIAHELGHLIYHYKNGETIISMEDDLDDELKEREANQFARNLFISDQIYNEFVEENNFSEKSIEIFSAKNKIHPGILVARLQHDGYLGMYEMNHKKTK